MLPLRLRKKRDEWETEKYTHNNIIAVLLQLMPGYDPAKKENAAARMCRLGGRKEPSIRMLERTDEAQTHLKRQTIVTSILSKNKTHEHTHIAAGNESPLCTSIHCCSWFSDTAYSTTDHITYPPHTRTHTLLTTQTHNSFILFLRKT